MASFRDSTTVTGSGALPQMTTGSVPATANYILQLDPSGHLELVDSSLVGASKPDTVETSVDEAVYKIRDDDFCFKEGSTILEHEFSDIDIDPVIEMGGIDLGIFNNSGNNNAASVSSVGGVRTYQPEIISVSSQDQPQIVNLNLGSHQFSAIPGNNILEEVNVNTINATEFLSQQFLQGGTQLDNSSYILCAAPGQNYMQLSTNQPTLQLSNSNLNSVNVQSGFSLADLSNVKLPSTVTNFSFANVSADDIGSVPQFVQASIRPATQEQLSSIQIVTADQVPSFTENAISSITSSTLNDSKVSVAEESVLADLDCEVKDEVPEENFNIQIVSCYSKQGEQEAPDQDNDNESSAVETKDSSESEKLEEDVNEDEDAKLTCSQDSNEVADASAKTEEMTDEAPKAEESDSTSQIDVEYKFPRIPEWLSGYVDEDDELLLAFKSRMDVTKTDICGFCYEWFDSEKHLFTHMEETHSNNLELLPCQICDARFFARVLLKRHEKLHKYDLKFRASVYAKRPNLKNHYVKRYRPAPFSEWYYNHVKEVCDLVENMPFVCYDCDSEFKTIDLAHEHYDKFHAAQTCGICGKQCENFTELQDHEKGYHGMYNLYKNYVGGGWTLWKNWLCNESLEKETILSNIAFFHDYTKKDPNNPPYEEDFCDEVVSEETDVTDEDSDEELSDSRSPKKQRQTGVDLDIDITGAELEILPYACDMCPKSYDNLHDLRRHARCHTKGSPGSGLHCQYCGKLFKTHSHKKEHERTHTGEKPYQCPICTRSFIQSSNLKKHVQTHKNKNTLQCKLCGKQFIKEASLVLHQRAHASDRKFRCEICDRAYNYASLLKRHMRIHTGEMPYSCDTCGMMFHELVSLHYHRKKVHTGERPHKCETCGRAFILSSDLKKHLQIHLKAGSSPTKSISPRKRSQSSNDSTDLDTPVTFMNGDKDLEKPVRVYRRRDTTKCEESRAGAVVKTTENLGKSISQIASTIISSKTFQTLKPVSGATEEGESSSENLKNSQEQLSVVQSLINLSGSTNDNHQQGVPVLAEFYLGGQLQRGEMYISADAFQDGQLNFLTTPSSVVSQNDSLQQSQTSQNQNITTAQQLNDVLQLPNVNPFSDFDMNNIVVVPPEPSSEIEIILDDNNQSMS